MPRPKKRTRENQSNDEEAPAYFAKAPAYYRAHEYDLPNDEELKDDIIRALLTRLCRRDVKEAKRVYHRIRLLMVSEMEWKERRPSYLQLKNTEMSTQEWSAHYGDHLYEIACGCKAGTEHWPPVLNMQRKLLEEAIRSSGYPEKAYDITRLKWLQEHGEQFDEIIHAIPCYCSYSFSVPDIPEKAFLGKKADTVNKLVSIILAELHHTSVLNIQKLAKKPGITHDGVVKWHIYQNPPSKRGAMENEQAINPPFPPFVLPYEGPFLPPKL